MVKKNKDLAAPVFIFACMEICINKKKLLFALTAWLCFVVNNTYGQKVTDTIPSSQFIGLFVSNLDSAKAWYADKLGFKIMHEENPGPDLKFAMLQLGDFLLEMIQNPKVISKRNAFKNDENKVGVEGFFKPGFYVEDIEGWEKTLKERKVKIAYPLMNNDKFKMKLFIIEDLEGNLIQFYKIHS